MIHGFSVNEEYLTKEPGNFQSILPHDRSVKYLNREHSESAFLEAAFPSGRARSRQVYELTVSAPEA